MKRIVICMDGTWQNLAWQTIDYDPITGGAVDRRTNVAKIAQQAAACDDHNNPQIVFYSPGVGARTFVTQNKKQVAHYEGATGEGSEENIIAAYLFLSFNYEPGDHIHLFGFSRGAFGVRSLAGLVRRCGILNRTETAQVRNALDLYRKDPGPDRDALAGRFRKQYCAARVAGVDTALDDPQAVKITFMGVFETVVMRKGLLELAGLAQPSREYSFHDLKLGNHVMAARHAMALDERRNTLPLTPWSNIGGFCEDRNCKPYAPDAPYQQKWFAGAHGDVGGGQSRPLSAVSRKWVLSGASRAGLKVNEPLRNDGDPSNPDFLNGEIEALISLGQLGYSDRIVFPEPPDPSEKNTVRRRRERAALEHLDQHVHVSVAVRMLSEGLGYWPRPLRPFKRLINPKARPFQEWLEQRKHEMFG